MHYYTHTHTRARAPRPANLFLFESARFLTCAARTTRTKYRDEERGGHGDRGRGGWRYCKRVARELKKNSLLGLHCEH